MWFKFLPSLRGFGEGLCHRNTKTVFYLYCDICDLLTNRFCCCVCYLHKAFPQVCTISAESQMSRNPHILISHLCAFLQVLLALFQNIWQLQSAFMDIIYTVTNVSQLGQVGVRSLLLVRLTFEAQSRMKTL